jgi:hypothetical protein
MNQTPPTLNTAVRDAATLMLADLDEQRLAISRELHRIPPPVPACDVDFNRLLEERAVIGDEMQRLKGMLAADPDEAGLLAFCQGARALTADTRARIKALLRCESR